MKVFPMKTPLKKRKNILIFLTLLLALAVLAGLLINRFISPSHIAFAENTTNAQTLSFKLVAENLDRPVSMTHAGDDTGRFFIVEQRGRIMILTDEIHSEPFLDITDRVQSPASNGGNEEGLLGLAFPPGYEDQGYFYVYYTMLDGDNVVSRFQLTADPDVADPASEEQILVLPHPTYTNHNGGQLAFGPDGYLYIGTGDGGGGGDPLENAQDPSSLNGKLLRIDVETETEPYAIPDDNPFVDDPAYRDEIWALGLRNPWRFSFDSQTGDLFIANVGQRDWEEVNFQPAHSPGGENYGWNIMEGEVCYPIGTTCDQTGLTLPVHTYARVGFPNDCSVTGGYVYRGSEFPALSGLYIYGDFCSGRIWGLRQNGDTWENQLLANTGFRISTFGMDQAGNLYVADMVAGEVFQITTVTLENRCYFPIFQK